MSMFLSLSLTSASTSAQLFSSDETQSKLCQSLQISEAPGLVLHPRRSARIISCPFPRPGKRVRLHFHRETQPFARMPRNRRCNIQIFHHRQDLVITLSHAASGEIPDMRVTPQGIFCGSPELFSKRNGGIMNHEPKSCPKFTPFEKMRWLWDVFPAFLFSRALPWSIFPCIYMAPRLKHFQINTLLLIQAWR